MTAPHIIGPAGLLGQALGDAPPDLMRHLLSTVINSLLSAKADAVCGAEADMWLTAVQGQKEAVLHALPAAADMASIKFGSAADR